MWKWVAGTAIITAVVAIVITWQAKRCESERDECQAATSARPFANPMLPIFGAPNGNGNQEQPQNQAGRACAHANAYICRVLTTANLPTIYLILIGAGGIAVAMGTLKILDQQTKAAESAAETARLNAQAAVNADRPWLLIPMGSEFPEIGHPILPDVNDKRVDSATFHLRNFGSFLARIVEQKAYLYIGSSPNSVPDAAAFDGRDAVCDVGITVFPQGSYISLNRLDPKRSHGP